MPSLQVWGVAKDLFEGAEAAAAELQPNAVETCRHCVLQALTRLIEAFLLRSANVCEVLKSTRSAAQAVITQYAPCLNCAWHRTKDVMSQPVALSSNLIQN